LESRSTMPAELLFIETSIRDWVLFPITLVMILVGILRHYVLQLITSSPKKQTRSAIREQRALLQAQLLRQTAQSSPIPPSHFAALTDHLTHAFTKGDYLKVDPSKPVERDEDGNRVAPPAMSSLSDPAMMEGMMGGMKNQFVTMVPQMLIMGWVNFFFSGFVLIKLPFPLTLGFKQMLQRGIDTPDMDVRWVSSLSWYILNWFGLNGLFRLLLGNDNAPQSDLASGAQAQIPQAGQPQDYHKLFAAEKENLQLVQGLYKWSVEDVDLRVLQKYGKLPKPAAS